MIVGAAILERIVEPETFTSMGVALWWAVSTVGTVGYGDIVPHTKLWDASSVGRRSCSRWR